MVTLPVGSVTLLFTDIEGSTRLLQSLGAGEYGAALQSHRLALRAAFARYDGVEVGTQGDSFFVAFPNAAGAVAAAVEAQLSLAGSAVSVRMGLHSGEPHVAAGEYVGLDVHKAARIAAAAHGGQILVSAETAQLLDASGLRELGDHRLKDLGHPQPIFQVLATGLVESFPPIRSLSHRANNLPIQLTPLIGRERETAEIAGWLTEQESRLVTLLGPGGIGKTRLAVQLGAECLESFADGVHLVQLASVTDAGVVPSVVARSFGLREEPGRTIAEVLDEFLTKKQILLILDNLEQVMGIAPWLARLLAATPGVRVLATSRNALRIRGEREYPLQLLGLPRQGERSIEPILGSSAVKLFVERATAVKPDFMVTGENAPVIAEICRRLDGLPLALELAAARIRILPPASMLARLQSRLKLLTGGARDLPERQQTLRSTIGWSYELLTEEEQVLFRRLAIFSGGCTLEAIERVCTEGLSARFDALSGVESLVEKSLLRQEETPWGEPRFFMLETIREFAIEVGEEELQGPLNERHMATYIELARQAAPHLGAAEQGEWLRRLERDHDNIRKALAFAFSSGDVGAAAQMAVSLQRFWMGRGHLAEGRGTIELVLERLDGAHASIAMLAAAAGTLARQQADLEGARRYFQFSLDSYRGAGDLRGEAMALLNLGAVAGEGGSFDEAAVLLGQARSALEALDEPVLLAMVLTNLGVVAEVRGQPAEAIELYGTSLKLYREQGDLERSALALSNMGHVACDQGDVKRAGELFRQSLSLAVQGGQTYSVAHEIANLGLVGAAAGEYERAAPLFAAAYAYLAEIGAQPMALDAEKYERAITWGRESLGEQWEAAWRRGERLSLDEAVDYALGAEAG